MAYDIRAWLDAEGSPKLEIVDADSGAVRVAWDARGQRSRAIKSLFHELMLLTVQAKLAPAERQVHDGR